MFEKLILKDEKYKQIYEDILLNSNNINHARRYTIKQFLMDNYNSYIEETKKEEQLIKRESNIYQTVLEDTLDKKLAKKVQVKYVSKKLLKDSLILSGTLSAMIVLSIPFYYNVAINLKKDELVENAIIYENELNEYNQNLENYINSIDWESLTDLEIFMLVMNDTWETIDGYQTPEKDYSSYHRLSLQECNVGVCRNIADDMTTKLNAINPEYNARNVIVESHFNDVVYADINIRKTEECLRLEAEESETPETQKDLIEIIGDMFLGTPNHMVTLVDIPGEDITLVLDPTNGAIGTLINGEIKLFNDPEGIHNIVNRSNYVFYNNEYKTLLNDQLESFNNDEIYEELEELYGIDAQNEALEKVRNM